MAVSNKEDICNLALDHIGKRAIVSLTEDSDEARKCRRHYDVARRSTLSASNWIFARASRLLPASASNEFPELWAFSYDLPNDMLTLRRLVEYGMMPNWNTPPEPMYLEGDHVLSNIPNARAYYTKNHTDVQRWSTLFDEAVALNLAARLAPSMTRKKSDVVDLKEQYRKALGDAVQQDAAQEMTSYRHGDGYVDARDGGSYGRRQLDGSTIWDSN